MWTIPSLNSIRFCTTDTTPVQARDRSGFALEALSSFGISGEMLGKHFDGDGAIEAGVVGFVDFTHAASTDG
jgi:hypothetical protein